MTNLLGYVLRGGVVSAACIVIAGGAIYLARHGLAPTEYQAFRSEPADFRSIQGILVQSRAQSGRGLIQLGLVVLITTPIVRVLCSVFGFARERDWTYVTITLIVLALLAYSLTAG